MWDGKKKAVTFSYDDGIVYDKKLVEIFNRYGLKCTFNLNSGIMTGANCWTDNNVEIKRMNFQGLPELYKGHEVAVHTLTHPNLLDYDDETVVNEILLDKINLENIFQYKIEGMAYPYGTYDERIKGLVKECGIKYCRTVESEGHAALPCNLLTLKPTMHHSDERIFDVIESFVELSPDEMDEPRMLYIWGHSYEFAVHDNWDRIEKICQMLSGRSDIFYGTNSEVLRPFYE
ncbi:MAG: polysaccharide deacetylase family protein [Clostridiales bacterium]|nr:polysaccharide deacetylase family protein [Clostridiales bacterium]